ncbi:MAG: protein-methionine-sulfoxide reductase catalytic subunit MsrP [Burkholderiaceae bacterium]|nr:protein-methionine-sulfoxide reductase catalytic subunit MsrP [Burkholderiaceae bacterium]
MSKLRLPKIPATQITPEAVWSSRRDWLRQAGMGALALGAGHILPAWAADDPAVSNSSALADQLTSERDITSYNNFYEFGTGKSDPHDYAGKMKLSPWTLSVEGEVAKPQVFDLDKLKQLAAIEERIYRMRCVEGWSMVIPWNGYSLSNLLKVVEPTSKAKFVEFTTVMQPEAMPGLKRRIINWPYIEALRIDEAVHPLTTLVFGVYGKDLLGQNGAPVRVAIPWKYGFKSGKSIVRIRLLEQMPLTSWVDVAPEEYGFYANVNPHVPHPRWSQATERRIGDSMFAPKVDTLMFNGYGDQVASLYTGMDLKRNY